MDPHRHNSEVSSKYPIHTQSLNPTEVSPDDAPQKSSQNFPQPGTVIYQRIEMLRHSITVPHKRFSVQIKRRKDNGCDNQKTAGVDRKITPSFLFYFFVCVISSSFSSFLSLLSSLPAVLILVNGLSVRPSLPQIQKFTSEHFFLLFASAVFFEPPKGDSPIPPEGASQMHTKESTEKCRYIHTGFSPPRNYETEILQENTAERTAESAAVSSERGDKSPLPP